MKINEEIIITPDNRNDSNEIYYIAVYGVSDSSYTLYADFEDKNDLLKAEICHKSALESLEENKKIEMYRGLEEGQ